MLDVYLSCSSLYNRDLVTALEVPVLIHVRVSVVLAWDLGNYLGRCVFLCLKTMETSIDKYTNQSASDIE